METMSCEKARALFDEELDGVIEECESKHLLAHLAVCETCCREYEALEKTHQHLAALTVEIPPELSARVMERVENVTADDIRNVLSLLNLNVVYTISK